MISQSNAVTRLWLYDVQWMAVLFVSPTKHWLAI